MRHLFFLGAVLAAMTAAVSRADTFLPINGLNACVPSDTLVVNDKLVTGDVPTPIILGSGHTANRLVKLEAITAVVVTTGVAVNIRRGRPQAGIEADENVLPLINTDLKDGVLTISASKAFAVKERVNVEVHLAHLKRLDVSGGGEVEIDAGVVDEDLTINVNGAAEIQAGGELKTLTVTVAGSVELRLAELTAATAEVTIAGNSDTELTVTDTLKATLTGTGAIVFHGEPKTRTVSVTGTGKIEQKK